MEKTGRMLWSQVHPGPIWVQGCRPSPQRSRDSHLGAQTDNPRCVDFPTVASGQGPKLSMSPGLVTCATFLESYRAVPPEQPPTLGQKQ